MTGDRPHPPQHTGTPPPASPRGGQASPSHKGSGHAAGSSRKGTHTRRGVRQGDPLGPLLFTMVLQGPLEAAIAAGATTKGCALHDDAALHGAAADAPPTTSCGCSALCCAVPLRRVPPLIVEPRVLCFARCASLCCFPAPSQCCCPARTHRAGQAGREALSLL